MLRSQRQLRRYPRTARRRPQRPANGWCKWHRFTSDADAQTREWEDQKRRERYAAGDADVFDVKADVLAVLAGAGFDASKAQITRDSLR